GSSNPSRLASSAKARSIRPDGVALHFSANRVSHARHWGVPRIETTFGKGPSGLGLGPRSAVFLAMIVASATFCGMGGVWTAVQLRTSRVWATKVVATLLTIRTAIAYVYLR